MGSRREKRRRRFKALRNAEKRERRPVYDVGKERLLLKFKMAVIAQKQRFSKTHRMEAIQNDGENIFRQGFIYSFRLDAR